MALLTLGMCSAACSGADKGNTPGAASAAGVGAIATRDAGAGTGAAGTSVNVPIAGQTAAVGGAGQAGSLPSDAGRRAAEAGSSAGAAQTAGAGGGTSGVGAGSNAGASGAGNMGNAGNAAGKGAAGAGGMGSTGCTPPAADPVVGWASSSGETTGGKDTAPMTVSSIADFTSAVGGTNAAVVWVKGSIKGNVKVGSNKSIIGVCGGEFHGHLELSGSSNVIIRNLKIVGYGVGDCSMDPSYDASVGCSSGADAVTVQNASNHIWIDHCDISDGTDGNLDITNAANYVTVSWTKFHYTARTDNNGNDSTGAEGHRFCNLVGGTDSPKMDDANSLNVTWHHNWWADGVVERQPRVRFGKNHLFNNLWSSSVSNYCIRAGKQAQILVEQSVFSGVKDPQQFNSSTDQGTANITSSNNVYTNTSGMQATGGGGPAFTKPPYTYTADPTSGLEAAIRSGVGPR
jgi:pectate lyase